MKKLFKVTLGVMIALTVIFGITACTPHEHTYSESWFSDETSHWRQTTCDHEAILIEKAEHEWAVKLLNGEKCGAGAVAKFTCKICGKTKEASAENHNYLPTETKAATCTQKGYTIYNCEYCQNTAYADFKNALGHNYGDGEAIKSETCTSDGEYKQICENCKVETTYEVNATGHNYVIVSDTESSTTYECSKCFEQTTVNDGEEVKQVVGKEEIFDVEPSFAFNITTDKDEDYIKENLKIVVNYFKGTEYENHKDVTWVYSLADNGDGTWTVTPASDYDYDTTYDAMLSGDLEFSDYLGNELTFTIENDENHENVIVYKDDIIFLKNLESENSGYYPYTLTFDENAESLYLTVGKIDGLDRGKILCVGEATRPEDFTKDNLCYFGKIDSYYNLSSGQYMVVMTTPELHEVFAEFDVSANGNLIFDADNVDKDQVEEELISALYQSEDFIKFLSVVNVSARKYFEDNVLSTSHIVSAKSFMDYIKLQPNVSFDGSTLLANIVGIIDVPILDSHKTPIGSFKVDFLVDMKSTFAFDVKYQLSWWWIFITGIEYFDISLIQTDTINFEFNVNIDVDYSLEEQRYVQNLDPKSLKIHRRGCPHLVNVKDTSKWIGLSEQEVKEKLAQYPELGCKHCQPVKGLQSEKLLINTARKVIHVYGCRYTSQISEQNKLISDEKASYWMGLGQGYTCCDWCHPDAREEFEYSAYFESTLYCSDWQQIATDISQWAIDSGYDKYNETGISIARADFVIFWPVEFSVEVRFIFSLKLEASLKYQYSYEQSNRYGVRIQWGNPYTYNTTTSEVLANELTLMGKMDVKVGLLVDANVNIWGLSQWIRAGITAEVGLYANLSGILHISLVESENYAAAYFEAGIYLDVNAYYQLFEWGGNVSIYSNEWPLILLGYEKAYFGYETYYEKLQINNSYDIADNDLLKVKYFDLKSMVTKIDELSLNEESKYKVTITFANGEYCKIEDGVIVAKEDAPCFFTDQIIITVECDDTWGEFKKGSAVYYLADYVIDIEFTSENNHNYVLTESQEADCENAGFEVYICSYCEDEYENTIPASGHKEVTVYGEEPTCTEAGLTDGVKCSVCEKMLVEQIIISAKGHDFVNRKCTKCGEVSSSSIGLAFTSNGDGTCYVSGIGTCKETQIVIPRTSPEADEVIAIGDYAFHYCGLLTSIEIPDGVISIGNSAFDHCYSLVSIEIPDSVTSIGNFAFSDCNFTSIVIPDSVTSIGDYAFYYCASLISIVIPDGVTKIGDCAFLHCESLKSIKIPNSVISIGNSSFSGCGSLASIEIPDGVISIGNSAFDHCSSLVSIKIPNSVTNIGADAFFNSAYYNDDNNWKEGVLYIDNHLIKARTNISGEYTINDRTLTIGDSAFYGCSLLISVVIPDSLRNIGSWAFCECSSLASVVIPYGITNIDDFAFYGCSSLESVTIGSGVTNIGKQAFYGCSKLNEAIFVNVGVGDQWYVFGTESLLLSNECLKNTEIAAEYLRDTYSDFEWEYIFVHIAPIPSDTE